jgi:phosphoribosylaminoimidazolecarboxamide formyltransferase/IMP cyclohydrolase
MSIKTVKNYKYVDKSKFKSALQNVPWWVCDIFDDLDDVQNAWELLYKDVVDEYITERKVKVRQNSLPWVNSEIRKRLNKRFKLLKNWQQTKYPIAHKNYKEARNLANIRMKKTEVEYWKSEFDNATNYKEFWKVVKKVHRKTKAIKIGPLEDDLGNVQTNEKEKAELMNNYFATVGEKLAEAFPAQIESEQFILRITPSIDQLKIDDKLLVNQIKTINPDKASGPDDIKPKDFNIAGEALMDGLRIVFNKSRETRKVPQAWKKGKLKAALKKGNSTKRSNYRPLTMLSLPSKMLEKHVSQ